MTAADMDLQLGDNLGNELGFGRTGSNSPLAFSTFSLRSCVTGLRVASRSSPLP
jgi:hypothetical protein